MHVQITIERHSEDSVATAEDLKSAVEHILRQYDVKGAQVSVRIKGSNAHLSRLASDFTAKLNDGVKQVSATARELWRTAAQRIPGARHKSTDVEVLKPPAAPQPSALERWEDEGGSPSPSPGVSPSRTSIN